MSANAKTISRRERSTVNSKRKQQLQSHLKELLLTDLKSVTGGAQEDVLITDGGTRGSL
jgi:hypothetical protein